MNRIAEFEKVSFEQFVSALREMITDMCQTEITDQDAFNKNAKEVYDQIVLPTRATSGSAGYDIVSPIDFELPPHCTIKIPTGIRVKIDRGWFFGCLPRSGLGFKYRLQLDNTMGVVDSDYYYSDNEGHIFLKLTNDNYQKKTLIVDSGDKIAQGIFLPYGITYTDNVRTERNGGFGSTGR